jgi:hypothetical protein
VHEIEARPYCDGQRAVIYNEREMMVGDGVACVEVERGFE